MDWPAIDWVAFSWLDIGQANWRVLILQPPLKRSFAMRYFELKRRQCITSKSETNKRNSLKANQNLEIPICWLKFAEFRFCCLLLFQPKQKHYFEWRCPGYKDISIDSLTLLWSNTTTKLKISINTLKHWMANDWS